MSPRGFSLFVFCLSVAANKFNELKLSMFKESKRKPLSLSDLRGPEADFATYCEAELERWRNSGKSFNETLFLEAIELAKRKLQVKMHGGGE